MTSSHLIPNRGSCQLLDHMVYNFRSELNTDQAWSGIDTPWSIIEDHGLISTPLVYYLKSWTRPLIVNFFEKNYSTFELGKNYSLLNLYIRTFGAKLSKKVYVVKLNTFFFYLESKIKKTKNI